MASQEVGHSTWFRSCIPIISVKYSEVQPCYLEWRLIVRAFFARNYSTTAL